MQVAVWTRRRMMPFPLIYRQYIEDPYANAYIKRLYEAESLETAGTKLWAIVAGRIVSELTQAGFYRPDVSATRLLLAYCLYWWRSLQNMWDVINGDTLLVLLEEIADTLPQSARIVHEGVELTVIDYETWKEKVRRQQEKRYKR